MYYVYILKQIDQDHFYIGSTNDLKRRLEEHRKHKNQYTRNNKWDLYCYFSFKHEALARKFEIYLKSGSGRAFSKKHFKF